MANKPWLGIGLVNPKSPSNVGTIMRAAGCYAVDAVFYSGTRYTMATRFNTDTQAVHERIPLHATEDLLASIPAGTRIVCVELALGATPLPQYQHADNAFYILGPEDGTIDQHLIDAADDVVYIPTIGCMNLAATVNVVLYDRLAKSNLSVATNELIRNSRDTNNRVRVTTTRARDLT